MTDPSDLIEIVQAAAEISGDELLHAAASALSSQSLSLSEAREEIESHKVALSVAVQEAEAWRAEAEREAANRAAAEREIERLKGLVAGIRECPQELADARAVITEANNSLFGSQGYFLSMNGGPADKYHLSRAIEDLKGRIRTLEADFLREGLQRIALERASRGLADATNDPASSSLSSLRKGAEVARPKVHHLGAALQGIADEHADVLTPRQKEALYQAASKLWDHAAAALVSGSREDGADA